MNVKDKFSKGKLKIRATRYQWDMRDQMLTAGVSSLGVPGVPWHPQILADQLTLSQPRGVDYSHQIILAHLPTALHYHSSIVLSTSKWGLAPTNNNSRTVEPLEIKGFPLQILQYVR